ncbi:MAG: hypothetical protein BWZ10_00940 [candidate division BRC1 bacterium ADurb.BinA364]|nr:MAG: hypothetical protein BWZ10_00940 [candidate division BRC1 bacterium ADurb.BinA364]
MDRSKTAPIPLAKFTVRTNRRTELIAITDQIRAAVAAAGLDSGLCIVYCPHTTAGITINENADPDVASDIERALSVLVPAEGDYRHAEGNSDAHLKASLAGASETVIVENGQLVLGRWQGLYFCEFDGPRTRTVFVKSIRG